LASEADRLQAELGVSVTIAGASDLYKQKLKKEALSWKRYPHLTESSLHGAPVSDFLLQKDESAECPKGKKFANFGISSKSFSDLQKSL
jgi:hypothetical protein